MFFGALQAKKHSVDALVVLVVVVVVVAVVVVVVVVVVRPAVFFSQFHSGQNPLEEQQKHSKDRCFCA